MKQKSTLSKLFSWFKETEMFERPSKKIPGKWILNEFYFEEEDLVHFSEDELKKKGYFFEIDFLDTGHFSHQVKLPVTVIMNMENGEWSLSKNFISLVQAKNVQAEITFQFSVEKGELKLLKKDHSGKIEFFGTFCKERDTINSPATSH